ncbi:hypothetical protein G6F57_002804 [Rhizopus arrhizus]|uniref:Reverse transcriptase domain-containing protein n=1 Tax=Rhizopus oryzae TaxID=64495 RepID=A0A9P7BVK0_RHIOR|nr:hypothetical protein G6F23_010235 [Rhizopus arrhizus]KAG0769723.1 hypothetical protein G6F24_000831 [Rhizopus arrhizus]KAG0788379.1 hypothetical protein G6F22_007025 [Rhizopus arrhizus]KAG0791510.1 hypothetical protein G6F21_005026 [Rhizopus arrhizus]KAG0836916.1 hypothetical protein G6F18_005142 [Rhizopus arrhizus]
MDEWLRDFWTTEMTAAFNRKEYYYKKWRKAHGFNALRLWVTHQEAQAKLRQLILKRRRETWRCFCDQMSQGNYSKAIAKFSRIRKNRTIKPTFSHIGGHSVLLIHNEQFDTNTSPFTIETVNDAIAHLLRRKAPGVDHLTIETILPITDRLTPILVYLFQICWRWSYTPLSWKVAQVFPICKKARKIIEKCLYPKLADQSPTLDIAQGDFRVARSTLDQALSLVEICSILRKHQKVTPTLAFLDIKSAYDTVDRRHMWQVLEQSLDSALLNLLKNLFNDVQIKILLGNAKSSRSSPATGLLQGSILSPFLYSIYINQLSNLLRDHPFADSSQTNPIELTLSINYLLYADDVVLIASPPHLTAFLQKCEDHSYQLSFCWNPLKCAILSPSSDTQDYALYGVTLPRQVSFNYLGIPVSPGGYLNTKELIQNNINKALKTMNQMTAIGVNSTSFDKLTSTRFYSQIVRPQLEYSLAISAVKFRKLQKTEPCQNQCLRRIFGGHFTLVHQGHATPTKFLLRTIDTPDDTLMFRLLPYIRTSASHSQWYKLTTSPLWRLCAETDPDQLDRRKFKAIRQDYLQESFENRRVDTNSILLSACRPQLIVDPILWLPMSCIERSRLICWRMGWLPGGRPKPCIYHPHDLLTRSHAITCLHMHHRLLMPSTVSDLLSYLLNLLPTSRKKPTIQPRSKYSAWFIR